eukprot:m.196434 g.196434  ORF g.196434 m.196434 type:complete len:333 (-) comp19805_c0_seq1:12-1010(-)
MAAPLSQSARLAALSKDNASLAADVAHITRCLAAARQRLSVLNATVKGHGSQGSSMHQPPPSHESTRAKGTEKDGAASTSTAASPSSGSSDTAPAGAGTERIYFTDTYAFTAKATVLSIHNTADAKQVMVLDRTVFHPQGGGQPSDVGTINGSGWHFDVTHVSSRREDNVIEHQGTLHAQSPLQPDALVGTTVSLVVDEASRRLHARLHSAGHLLDAALTNLGRTDLEPGKGYHFAEGPYVEYIGAVSNDDKDKLMADVNRKCQRLIDAGVPTVVTNEVDPSTGQGLRVVNVGGCTCPCGGTHVKNTSELKSITVTRIKKAKKNVKFSYTVG